MSSADSSDGTGGTALGRFLTLTDTAEILNVSASQASSLVRSGELPAIKIGGHGRWRIERSVLESYIEAKYEEVRRMSKRLELDQSSYPSSNGSTMRVSIPCSEQA